MPLTVRLVPRYDESSSRTEVTQKVLSSVELPVGVVLVEVELSEVVELASNGSVLEESASTITQELDLAHVFRQTSSRTNGYRPKIPSTSEASTL